MNDKKQIEELASLMAHCNTTCDVCFEKYERVMTMKIKERAKYCQVYAYAKRAVEQGYRKIPKDSVVLTKEEYEKYQNLKRDAEYSFEYNQGYIDGQNQTRKEMAENLAKSLKETPVDTSFQSNHS